MTAAAAGAVAAGPATQPARISAATRAQIAQNYGKIPLSFEANQGQVDKSVKFLSRGNGYSLFLTDSAAVLALNQPDAAKKPAKAGVIRMELAGASRNMSAAGADQLTGKANYFIGNDQAQWHSGVPTYAKVRYRGVYPGIDLVYYGNQRQLEYDFVVAPGADPSAIRLRFGGATPIALAPDGGLSVRAGGAGVVFHKPDIYQLADGRRIPVAGEFALLAKNSIGFKLGQYDRAKPLVIDPVLVYSTFLSGSGFGWSDDYGNEGLNGGEGTQIAVDKTGNVYLAGTTSVLDFPVTTGSLQGAPGGTAYTGNGSYSFVLKLDPTGSNLIYSTYFGGKGENQYSSGSDWVAGTVISSLFVDSAGDAYLCGGTYSRDFPISAGAFLAIKDSADYSPIGFVSKINPAGNSLLYSTYLGGGSGAGGNGEQCFAIAANSSGNAYVTGFTTAQNFPVTKGAFQTSSNAGNFSATSYVTEFNPAGTGLVYSTYLGGSADNEGLAIAVDAAGNAYVGGATESTDFPVTAHAYQQINKPAVAHEEATGFVAKLNPAGSKLLYATYLGGTGGNTLYATPEEWYASELITGLAVNAAGDVYVNGVTVSRDFPVTSDALQKTNKTVNNAGNANEFVTELKPDLSGLLYSTYLGSTEGESPASGKGTLALDSSGNIYVTGTTRGWDFPVTANAIQPVNNSQVLQDGKPVSARTNAFVTEISASGKLAYSSYLGGSSDQADADGDPRVGDYGASLALDPTGNVYVTGTAASYDFPVTPGAFQTSKAVQNAAFVAKFNLAASATSESTITSLVADANPQTSGNKVTFTVHVGSISGESTPTGTVQFSVAGAIQAVQLNSNGDADYATTKLPLGQIVVTASYSGDKTHTASSDKLTELMVGAPAAIWLVSGSGQTLVEGIPAPKPIVVQVKDAKGTPVPDVVVSFGGQAGLEYLGGYNPEVYGSAVTDLNGQAEIGVLSNTTGTVSGDASVNGVTTPAYFTMKVIPQAATPNVAPDFIPYNTPITVTMTDSTPGAVIYYTTNGTDPTTSSTKYSVPFVVSATTTIKAIAAAPGYGNSTVFWGEYIIPPPASEPAISPSTGIYSAAKTVTITDTTPGATICYTTNGTTPTPYSPRYSGSFTVSQSTFVQAIAVANGYSSSPVAGSSIVIGTSDAPAYSDGTLTTAGGVPGYWGNSGNNGPFAKTLLNDPGYVFVDSANNLYVVEYWNHDVRKVSLATRTITLFAGNGTAGYSGDQGKATAAELHNPGAGAADSEGNVYIVDTGNNVIRKVAASTGDITTVAGTGKSGYAGDGKAATLAELNSPSGVAVDSAGNLYIADTGNSLVREVSAKTGEISTVVGVPGEWGWAGDGGLATAAKILYPLAVMVDTSGNLYVSDSGNSAVRRVDAKTGKISTVAGDCSTSAGSCTSGYSGDGGPAVAAKLDYPHELALDKAGNLYIADTFNNLVRQVNAKTGVITTAAGNGKGTAATTWDSGGYGGDGGPAILAILDNPTGVAIDASGDLYIGDDQNNLVREVFPAP
jgi:sugar lactone lactonase YvrE